MKKRQVSWEEYQGLIAKICRDISNSNWRPDYVVGITRGGLLPAKMISYYFEVPCETLKVQLRDGDSCESNLWMAEDAFGYEIYDPMISGSGQKKILIVDDINDTGATLNWIINDWTSGCLPDDERWDDVWGNNVRFAVIFDNLASKCVTSMNYSGVEINKEEDPAWIDFPYEDWWTK
jgi:xanthine phosphoribosyltransferase